MKVRYLEIFNVFFKVGIMSIGGGYVMLPMIEREVVDVKKWCDIDEVFDFYTLGQSLPGMISVNTATLIGYKLKGFKGAVIATLGMIMPSLVILMIIAAFFSTIQNNPIVQSAFGTIRAAVVATIAFAVIKMAKKSIDSFYNIILTILSFGLFYFLDVSPFYIVIGAVLVGIIHGLVVKRRDK